MSRRSRTIEELVQARKHRQAAANEDRTWSCKCKPCEASRLALQQRPRSMLAHAAYANVDKIVKHLRTKLADREKRIKAARKLLVYGVLQGQPLDTWSEEEQEIERVLDLRKPVPRAIRSPRQ